MKLLLIRHAKTTAADGLCYGRTDVPVLAELTQAAAAQVAAALPAGIEMACSPLSRCSDLAGAISALRPDLRAVTDPRIAEMDLGDWEERPWAAIARAELDAWSDGFADTRAGGSGESTRQFIARVAGAFDAWRDSGRDAVWVTHAGVIRAVRLLHGGVRVVERADQWPAEPIAFGALVSFEL